MTTIPEGSCAKWVLSSAGVVVEISATLDGKGNAVFTYELISGTADLNGFFIDIDNDGGSITKLGGGNNMNGSDTDGDKLNGFDFAQALGTVGGNDADNTSGQVVVSLSKLGVSSLSELADAEIGIRATSVGDNREGSLKLAGTGTVCEPEPVDLCDRAPDGPNVDGVVAMQENQITQLSFVVWIPPVIDDEGIHFPGDTTGDAYYTVTVNVPAEMGEDPDAYLNDLIAEIIAADPNVGENPLVKSVIVTDCHGNRENYAIAFNENGEATDLLTQNLFKDSDQILDEMTDIAGHTEATYDLVLSGDEFHFV